MTARSEQDVKERGKEETRQCKISFIIASPLSTVRNAKGYPSPILIALPEFADDYRYNENHQHGYDCHGNNLVGSHPVGGQCLEPCLKGTDAITYAPYRAASCYSCRYIPRPRAT